MCDCVPIPSAPDQPAAPTPHIRHAFKYVPCEQPKQTFKEYKILLFLRRNQIDTSKARKLLTSIAKSASHLPMGIQDFSR
jgi:hypothetical protein